MDAHTESHQWPSLNDYTFTYKYPANGIGAIVNFVEIIVEQVRFEFESLFKRFVLYLFEKNPITQLNVRTHQMDMLIPFRVISVIGK